MKAVLPKGENVIKIVDFFTVNGAGWSQPAHLPIPYSTYSTKNKIIDRNPSGYAC